MSLNGALRPSVGSAVAEVMDSIVGFCYARLPVDHAPHHRVRVLIESDIGPFRDGRPSTVDSGLQVLVRDNNVDQALKALKKKMQREGIFREMRLRDHYEKPSEKRAREKSEAVRRARKLARKALQREGLLPVKPRPVPGLR